MQVRGQCPVPDNQQYSPLSGAGPLDPTYGHITANRDAFGRVLHLYGDSLFRGFALGVFADDAPPTQAVADKLWDFRSPAAMINLLCEGQGLSRAPDGGVTGGPLVAAYAGLAGQPDAGLVAVVANGLRRSIDQEIIRAGDVVALIGAGAHNGDPEDYFRNWLLLRRTVLAAKATLIMFDMFDYDKPFIAREEVAFYCYDALYSGRLSGVAQSHNEATRMAARANCGGRGRTILYGARHAMDRFRAEMAARYAVPVMRRDGIHPHIWGQWLLAGMIAWVADPDLLSPLSTAVTEKLRRSWRNLGNYTESESWTEDAACAVIPEIIKPIVEANV